MTETTFYADLAWAVGLYEGEGTACLASNGKSTRVAIQMQDPEPIERFYQIIRIGTINKSQPPGRKTTYTWQVQNARDVIKVLTILIDSGYLSSRRLRQAETILERAKQIKPNRDKDKDRALLQRLGLITA